MAKNKDSNEDKQPSITEFIKKLTSAGLGAAFMTEEGVRSYLSSIKLPKEVLNSVLQGANNSKEEMISRVTDEVIKIVRSIDFVAEASRFVEEHKFKINAEIEVTKKSQN